jgi:hypothetical protein
MPSLFCVHTHACVLINQYSTGLLSVTLLTKKPNCMKNELDELQSFVFAGGPSTPRSTAEYFPDDAITSRQPQYAQPVNPTNPEIRSGPGSRSTRSASQSQGSSSSSVESLASRCQCYETFLRLQFTNVRYKLTCFLRKAFPHLSNACE